MDDLISRQVAIDAICEHGTDLERRGITVLAVTNHKQVTVDLLEKLPSIDAVEVVRCKDCKHWTTMVERPKHGTCDQWCTLNVTRRDEYCSKAERKES